MPPRLNKKNRHEYKQRLKELKQKLRPYRDRDTVRLLRVITGSSAVNLKNYWERLESVLTGEYSHGVVRERIQTVVNDILESGEYAKSIRLSSSVNMMSNELTNLHINSKSKVSDNVTRRAKTVDKSSLINYMAHINSILNSNVSGNIGFGNINSNSNMSGNMGFGNINSNSNMSSNMGLGNINSNSNMSGNMGLGNINLNSNVSGDMGLGNINSNSNVSGSMGLGNINSNSNVSGSMGLGTINSNSNVSGNVKNGNIDMKTDVINRLRLMHIDSSKSGYYKRL